MTRMWLVDTEILCKNHLLGEHKEIHQFVGQLNSGQSVTGYFTKGLVDPTQIFSRHEELVSEMLRRGYEHHSPLEFEIEDWMLHVGRVDSNANFWELYRRCEFCRVRILERYEI